MLAITSSSITEGGLPNVAPDASGLGVLVDGALGMRDALQGDQLLFYTGLHQPGDAQHFDRACISIHRLERRKKPVACRDVFIDSGAFTKLEKHGQYPEPVEVYAAQLHRLDTQGVVKIAVASCQDYMCEPFMLAKTGLTVLDHQRMTIERYDALLDALNELYDGLIPFQVMPVIQGFSTEDYLRHMDMYGDRLKPGMWVGIGSVCKRQGNVAIIEDLLLAIHAKRPDLRYHGFGVKLTALQSAIVRRVLYSADSMAWSFAARKLGRNPNDWREAKEFERRALIPSFEPEQYRLFS